MSNVYTLLSTGCHIGRGYDPYMNSYYIVLMPNGEVRAVLNTSDRSAAFSPALVKKGFEYQLFSRDDWEGKIIERDSVSGELISFLKSYDYTSPINALYGDRPYVTKKYPYIHPQEPGKMLGSLYTIEAPSEDESWQHLVLFKDGKSDFSHLYRLRTSNNGATYFKTPDDLIKESRPPLDGALQAIMDYESGLFNFGTPHPDSLPLVIDSEWADTNCNTLKYRLHGWQNEVWQITGHKTARGIELPPETTEKDSRAILAYSNANKPASNEKFFITATAPYWTDPYHKTGLLGCVYQIVYQDGSFRDIAKLGTSNPDEPVALKYLSPDHVCQFAYSISVTRRAIAMNAFFYEHEDVSDAVKKAISDFDATPKIKDIYGCSNYAIHNETPFIYQSPSGQQSWGVVYSVAIPHHKPMAVACYSVKEASSDILRKEFRRLAYTATRNERTPELNKGLWERVCTDSVFINRPIPQEIKEFVDAYDKALGAQSIAEAITYKKKYAPTTYTAQDDELRTRLLHQVPVYKNSNGHPYLLNYQ